MEMVMDRVCRGACKGKRSGKVDIQTVPDLALKVVLQSSTKSSATHHHAGYGIAAVARGHKDAAIASIRVYEPNYL